MFTINHVHGDLTESLYSQVPSVIFSPANPDGDGKSNVVFTDEAIGAQVQIDGGRVYIMNDKGATVRRYILAGDHMHEHGVHQGLPGAT